MLKINLIENTKKEKPSKKEYGVIQKTICSEENIKEIDFNTFVDLVGNNGAIWKSSFMKGGAKNINFKCAYMLSLDFDNGISINDFLENAKDLGLEPTFIYETFSSTSDFNRFRAIWKLKEVIKYPQLKTALQLMLMEVFSDCDNACKDLSRLWIGGKSVAFYNPMNTLNIENLLNALFNTINLKEPSQVSRNIKAFCKKAGLNMYNKMPYILKSVEFHEPRNKALKSVEFHEPRNKALKSVEFHEYDNYVFSFTNQYDINKNKNLSSKIQIVKTNKHKKYKVNFSRLSSRCKLFNSFIQGQKLDHREIQHLSFNLCQFEGYKTLLKNTLVENKYNNWQNKFNTYISAINYNYAPTSCQNYCKYCNECKNPKNIRNKYYEKDEKSKAFELDKLNLLDKIIEKNDKNLTEEQKQLYKEQKIKQIKKQKFNETINFTKYQPTQIVKIDKYIGEKQDYLKEILQYDNSLLIAPTGSGKTYTILNTLKSMQRLFKKQNIKVCFIVPNSTQVQQIQEEYGIKGAWDSANQDLIFIQNTISCYTWDKFGKIQEDLSNTIVFLDEIHQIYTEMYRKNTINKMIKNLSKCKTRIDITATPNKLDFSKYDYVLEYRQNTQTNYNIKLYNEININKIVEIIENSNKFALFRNNKSFLEALKENLNKKCDVIHSGNKDSNITYANIIKNSSIANTDGLLNTSVITAGVNIKDENITDIILVGVKDIATIKQYIARFRDLENVNVHIFNSYKKDISKTFDIEYIINSEIAYAQLTCDYYNRRKIEGFEELILTPTIFEDLQGQLNIYISNGIYKVDTVGIRNKIYSAYFYKADEISFKYLMEEYFSNIEVVEIKKENNSDIEIVEKNLNKISKEYIDELEKHKNYLVDIYNIKKNIIRLESKEYLKENNLSVADIKKYMEFNNLEYMLKDTKVKKHIEKYTKLTTKYKYTNNIAYKMSSFSNAKNSSFKNKLNILIFEEIKKKYSNLICYDNVEFKLYNALLENFKLNMLFTKEDVFNFREKIKDELEINLTDRKIYNYLSDLYFIKKTRTQNMEKRTPYEYNIYKNTLSYGVQKSNNIHKSKITINKISERINLDILCNQYGFTSIDKKYLEKFINNKVKSILNEAKKIINLKIIDF